MIVTLQWLVWPTLSSPGNPAREYQHFHIHIQPRAQGPSRNSYCQKVSVHWSPSQNLYRHLHVPCSCSEATELLHLMGLWWDHSLGWINTKHSRKDSDSTLLLLHFCTLGLLLGYTNLEPSLFNSKQTEFINNKTAYSYMVSLIVSPLKVSEPENLIFLNLIKQCLSVCYVPNYGGWYILYKII